MNFSGSILTKLCLSSSQPNAATPRKCGKVIV